MKESKPLTVKEYDNLFRVLELMSQNIERLLTQGVVLTEGGEESQISSSQNRIHQYRERIRREQERIKRLRQWLRNKRKVNRH